MKDIDFDELDKAVNSLMEGVEQPGDVSPSAGTGESSDSQTVQEAPAPAANDSTPASQDKGTALAATSPAPAVKRTGGRFMDIVHPSTTMRTTPKPASREGVAIAPLSAPAAAPTSPEPVPAPAPDTPVPAVSHSDWPDPIDLHEQQSAVTTPSQDTESTEAPVAPAPAVSDTPDMPDIPVPEPADLQDSSSISPESPFLPDAKVEKRPLGEAAPTGQVDEAVLQEEASTLDDAGEPNAPLVASEIKAELPVELEPNLVAVEAGASELAADTPEETDKDTSPSVPAVPSSIPQQYKEKESSGAQDHAALYDSEDAGAPLQHPAKKKTGWLWVVWVIFLIALGAGGAFALYSFNLLPV